MNPQKSPTATALVMERLFVPKYAGGRLYLLKKVSILPF
jgi:hypothetical protein